MNTLRMWWLKFQHGALMDRAAMLETLKREAQREYDDVMAEAAILRRRINNNARRMTYGLRVI